MRILRSVNGIMRIPGQIMAQYYQDNENTKVSYWDNEDTRSDNGMFVNGRVIRIKRILRSVKWGSIQDNEDTQVS
jgi:hypothetical protein